MVDTNKPNAGNFSSKEIIKEGWLEKESRFRKVWRKRWCVLTAGFLYTFENEKQYGNATETIEVSKIKTVKTDEAKGKNIFKIEMTDSTFYFQGETFQMKEAWIGSIGNAMIKGSKSHIFIKDDDDDQ